MVLAVIRDLFPTPTHQQRALIGPRCLALVDQEKALIEACLKRITEEEIVQAYRDSPLFTERLESMLFEKRTLDDYWAYSGAVAGGCAGAYLGGCDRVVEMAIRTPSPIGEFLTRAVGTLVGVYCGSHLARAAAVRLPVNRKIAERREEKRNPLVGSAKTYHEEQRMQGIRILSDLLGEATLLNDQEELKRLCVWYNQRVITQEFCAARAEAGSVSQLSDGERAQIQYDYRDENDEVVFFYRAQPGHRRAVAQEMLADLEARDQRLSLDLRDKILACADSPRLITLPNTAPFTVAMGLCASGRL